MMRPSSYGVGDLLTTITPVCGLVMAVPCPLSQPRHNRLPFGFRALALVAEHGFLHTQRSASSSFSLRQAADGLR